MNYDKIISKLFFNDNRINKSLLYKLQRNKRKYSNIKEYLINKYCDDSGFTETLYRIKNNIIIKPTCKICGKPVKFSVKNDNLYNEYCSVKCRSIDNGVKIKKTKLERYNDEKYNNTNKSKETKLKKYGNETYNNKQKYKQTCLRKYGVDNVFKSTKFKENYKANLSDINTKKYLTHLKNKSFNTSNTENESYILLKDKFNDIIRQYRSDKYPFECDFYIPNLDLYIECNYHWTHGNKQYEGIKEDINKVNTWKSKHTKYYDNAIYTWTNLDIRKYNIIKENNLKCKIFYSIEELKTWLNEI